MRSKVSEGSSCASACRALPSPLSRLPGPCHHHHKSAYSQRLDDACLNVSCWRCALRCQDATYIKVPSTRTRIAAKKYKTRVFELTQAKRVLYLDADMLVNHPLDAFLVSIGPWNPSCDAYMFAERWYTASDFNSGTIYLDSERSKALLDDWLVR